MQEVERRADLHNKPDRRDSQCFEQKGLGFDKSGSQEERKDREMMLFVV